MKIKWMIFAVILCFSISQVGCQASHPTELTKLGFIQNFNIKSQTFDFDEIEWISLEDTKRIEELQLETDVSMPNGFYIYNEDKSLENYKVTDQTIYQLINHEDLSKFVNVSIDEFSKFLEKFKDLNEIPYTITVQNGNVLVVKEQYVP